MEVDTIPFETFTSFERLTAEEPLLSVEPPAWGADAQSNGRISRSVQTHS